MAWFSSRNNLRWMIMYVKNGIMTPQETTSARNAKPRDTPNLTETLS